MTSLRVLYGRLQEEGFLKKISEALVSKNESGGALREILYQLFNDEALRKDADDFVLKFPIRYEDPDASVADCTFIQVFWWARVRFIQSQPEMFIEDPFLVSDAHRSVVLLYRSIQMQQKVLAEKTKIAVEEINFLAHRDYDLPSATLTRTLPSINLLPRLVTDIVLLSPSMVLPHRFFPRVETLLLNRGSEPFIRDYVIGIVFRTSGNRCYMCNEDLTPDEFGTHVAVKEFENLYPETCKLLVEKASVIHELFGTGGSDYCLQLLCNTTTSPEAAMRMAEGIFSDPRITPRRIGRIRELPYDLRPWVFLVYETIRMRKLRRLSEEMPALAAERTMQQIYGHVYWKDKYRHSVMMGVVDREFGREYKGRKYSRALRRYYAAGYFLLEHYYDYSLLNSLSKLR